MTTTTRRNPLAAREAQPVALASEGRETEQVQIDQIRTDGGTQMRAGLNDSTVSEYAEFFQQQRAWGSFPPVVVFYDGADYWLGDGFHRLAGWKQSGNPMMGLATIPAAVRVGTRRDAVLYAAAANADHGLRRTNADKRRAVETLLNDPEWSQWSDREIARRCKVSNQFVSNLRSAIEAASLSLSTVDSDKLAERIYTTKHGTTATMNVTGQRQAAQNYASVWTLEEEVWRWGRECNATVDMLEDLLRGPEASQHWPALSAVLSEPRRMANVKEAIRQVIASFRRQGSQCSPPSTPEAKKTQAQADVEQWVATPPSPVAKPVAPAGAPRDYLAGCTHRGQILIQPAVKSGGVRTAHILLCEECGHFQAVIEVAFQRHTVDFRLDSERAVEAASQWLAHLGEVGE